MLDNASTFQQAVLILFTLEIVTQTALYNSFQIACQLTNFPCSEKHVWCAVVIKEKCRIVEMTQA